MLVKFYFLFFTLANLNLWWGGRDFEVCEWLTKTCLSAARWFNPLQPSGHYMYRTVVTICTTSLAFNNSTFCPQSIFMGFVWIWKQTAIISLYSINWLDFYNSYLTLYSSMVTICTASLTFKKFYVLPKQRIFGFCVDLRTNSDYFPIQH